MFETFTNKLVNYNKRFEYIDKYLLCTPEQIVGSDYNTVTFLKPTMGQIIGNVCFSIWAMQIAIIAVVPIFIINKISGEGFFDCKQNVFDTNKPKKYLGNELFKLFLSPGKIISCMIGRTVDGIIALGSKIVSMCKSWFGGGKPDNGGDGPKKGLFALAIAFAYDIYGKVAGLVDSYLLGRNTALLLANESNSFEVNQPDNAPKKVPLAIAPNVASPNMENNNASLLNNVPQNTTSHTKSEEERRGTSSVSQIK